MKTQPFCSLLALATGLQQAAASWKNSPAYKCPSTNPDKCIPDQEGGYDWSGLGVGSFQEYKGLTWDGWACSNQFSKRDNNKFQSKCITGQVSSKPEECPSFSCGSSNGISSFSIDTFQISVEFDCELEFHYDMGDGSTCKHKSPCSAGGSTIKNSQCGGAKKVTIVLPSPPPSKPSCNVGIHKIDFHCPTTPVTTVPATTSAPIPSSTAPAASSYATTPSSSAPAASSYAPSPSSSASAPSSYAPSPSPSAPAPSSYAPSPSSSTLASIPYAPGPSSSAPASIPYAPSPSSSAPASIPYAPGPSSSTPASIPYVPGPSSSAPIIMSSYGPVYSTPATSPAPTTAPVSLTTVVVETTVTTCPVTTVITTGGITTTQVSQTVSTIYLTKTSTICNKCTEAPAPFSSATYSAPSFVPIEPCPAILPSCLNTWLTAASCSSNTDSSCYCPSANMTALIFECLYAHGSSDDEVYAAQAYFQGLCAPYAPQNPAIVTAAYPVAVPPATIPYVGPLTIVTVVATLFSPCTVSGSPTSTYTVVTSAVTVPQVVVQTNPAYVGLVPGTALPVATASGYGPTSFAAVPTGTTVNSTTTSTTVPKYTGAASKANMGIGVIGAALVFAVFAI